jgi:membrane protein DedA with SNARE-associated domain
MSVLKILPLTVVMIAGPQILSAIFLATSQSWKRNSAAYILGAALSISLAITAGYLLGHGARDQGASNDTLYIIILVLLVVAALHTFLTRKQPKDPPKWMGKLATANPGFSFKLGFLLLGVFPTDILTSFAVGGYLASQDEPLWKFLPFLALTLFLLAIPALLLVAMGKRGEALLPKVRDWMNQNSWVVNEVVILLFIALTVNNLT